MPMCEWGNCQEDRKEHLTVRISYRKGEERPVFCSAEHAAAWLIRRLHPHHPGRNWLANHVASLDGRVEYNVPAEFPNAR